VCPPGLPPGGKARLVKLAVSEDDTGDQAAKRRTATFYYETMQPLELQLQLGGPSRPADDWWTWFVAVLKQLRRTAIEAGEIQDGGWADTVLDNIA
jgi:hypothetical protein